MEKNERANLFKLKTHFFQLIAIYLGRFCCKFPEAAGFFNICPLPVTRHPSRFCASSKNACSFSLSPDSEDHFDLSEMTAANAAIPLIGFLALVSPLSLSWISISGWRMRHANGPFDLVREKMDWLLISPYLSHFLSSFSL